MADQKTCNIAPAVLIAAAFFLTMLFLDACVTLKSKQDDDTFFSSDSGLKMGFESLIEDEGDIYFPGYLIGLERSQKNIIGAGDYGLNFDLLPQYTRSFYKDILKNDKRTFVSQVISYESDNESRGIKPQLIFDAHYIMKRKKPGYTNIYDLGGIIITDLKARIKDYINKKSISHLIIYAVNWDENFFEALTNYNNLFSYLSDIIEEKGIKRTLNPLMLGICWPNYEDSYSRKAEGADEVGMLWLNLLLNKVVLPLKSEEDIKIVMIGNGFGSRAVTTSVFSSELISDNKTELNEKVDLVIGLEGNFSIDRFIFGKGYEPPLYFKYQDKVKKFVYAWSKYYRFSSFDRLITGEVPIGGEAAWEAAKEYPDIFDVGILNKDATGIVKEDIKRNKILMVDVSNIVSDDRSRQEIKFTPQTARFIWDCIQGFEPEVKEPAVEAGEAEPQEIQPPSEIDLLNDLFNDAKP